MTSNHKSTIPNLYETEETPLEDKMIHQMWEIEHIGFYWLIAELDPKNEFAFGYANLNDKQMAEWGYISIKELKQNGATMAEEWKPTKFQDLNLETILSVRQNG